MPTLLLDNDGTCVDTEGLTVPHLLDKIRQSTGGKVNVALDDFFARYHGGAGKVLIEAISRDYGHPIDYDDVYGNRIAEVADLFRTTRLRAAPGIGKVLRALDALGWQIAVVSNEPATRGIAALENTANGDGSVVLELSKRRYFEAGANRKPKPDVYLHAMQKLGVKPDDCVAVEDSRTGVLAAVAAGLTCYGYTGLAYPAQAAHIAADLLASGAVALFDDWAGFPALLASRKAA